MLQEYKRKRDFKITPEPSGKTKVETSKVAKEKALTFVVQKHAASRLHYDFRLEVDGVMVSWAVPKGPSLDASEKRLAVMTEDHPMEYSSFEGIIPEKQYGAGEVIIWDQGTYSPDENNEYSWSDKSEANDHMRSGLKKGKLTFFLKGDKLEGSWTLVKMHNKAREWLLIKRHDKFEDADRDITESDASVVSGLTLKDIQENGADRIWTSKGSQPAERYNSEKTSKSQATKSASKSATKSKSKKESLSSNVLDDALRGAKPAPFPRSIGPMLATLADEPFIAEGWFFEPKLDGIRAIAYVKDGSVKLQSRRGLDLSDKYPAICQDLSQHSGQFVFDGEIVALDENGKPSFQLLQQSGGGLRSFASRNQKFTGHLNYYVFDLLYADGNDLTGVPLIERKKYLQGVLSSSDKVKFVKSLGDDGLAVFQACVEHGLEGIVGKKAASKYEVGSRSRSWLKVKTSTSSEFLICGYTEGTGARKQTFGSLILGEYDEQGILQFVGGVGTGFDDKKLVSLRSKLEPLTIKQTPFKKRLVGKLNSTWVKPELVCEVKYRERTQDNMLRAPVFLHLREDLDPKKIKAAPVVHVQSEQGAKLKAASNLHRAS